MTEPPRRGRVDRRGRDRDYTTIGEVSDPAFVRLPVPGTVFATRSARLAALAAGNPLAPYLAFLSGLAAVQHAAQDTLPQPPPLAEARLNRHLSSTMPPLSKLTLSEDEGFARTLEWFIQHAAMPDAPEAAERARARLRAMPWPERLILAEAILEGAYPADQLAECLYVAEAIQVHLTRLAARLDATHLRSVADGQCPACGGGPVASMVVGWANADRARYCCCSLCATVWNYVRIKCTTCGSTAGISYYLVEEQSNDVAVETCTTCRSYIKHFHQQRKPEIEPFADDIASFSLDVLVREKDFYRATANPLMVFT